MLLHVDIVKNIFYVIYNKIRCGNKNIKFSLSFQFHELEARLGDCELHNGLKSALSALATKVVKTERAVKCTLRL